MLDLAFKRAVRLLDRLGHGVETGGQLAQFVMGLMVDPHLELAATKALGGGHQLLQRRDDAILQFVKPEQQDDQRSEQGQALNDLLPALLLLALALEQADELVQLFDEGQGHGLKSTCIATLKCRVQIILPALLDLPIADLQIGGRAIFQHRLEGMAIEAGLQAVSDGSDFFAGSASGQFPAQVVSLHAHRASGIDGGGIALAEPGDQSGAQRAGQGEDGDEDHRQPGASGQGAAQPAHHQR